MNNKKILAFALSLGVIMQSGTVVIADADTAETNPTVGENTAVNNTASTGGGQSDALAEPVIRDPSGGGGSSSVGGSSQGEEPSPGGQTPTEDPSSGSSSTSGGSSSGSSSTSGGSSSGSSSTSGGSSSGSSSTSGSSSSGSSSSSGESSSESSSSASSSSGSSSESSSSGSSTSESSSSSGSSSSESSASSESSSENDEKKSESEDEKKEYVAGFTKIVSITVTKGTALSKVIAELPTTVEAVLSDGDKIDIPVDWTCPQGYKADRVGDYVFASELKKNEDGTVYSIGYPLGKDVKFPKVVVKVQEKAKKDEAKKENKTNQSSGEKEGRPLVMDDITGSRISPAEGEERIFRYLVRELGLNQAAACGILANIHAESNFNPHAIGDGGTSYGICQWHLGRYTALVSFCNSIGLSYGSVEGQLKYLEYELSTNYGGVLAYLKGVPNTAEGAYQAGYYWCFHFERPAQIHVQSSYRGNAAKNSYWPRYKDASVEVPKATTRYGGEDYSAVYQYEYFLKYNPDLEERYKDDPESAIEYFVTKGMELGLDGCSEFDLESYKARYPELVEEFGEDNKAYYTHYIETGKKEKLNATACVYEDVNYMLFYDYKYFLNEYSDMKIAYREDSRAALEHFVTKGREEGKRGLAEDPIPLCLKDMDKSDAATDEVPETSAKTKKADAEKENTVKEEAAAETENVEKKAEASAETENDEKKDEAAAETENDVKKEEAAAEPENTVKKEEAVREESSVSSSLAAGAESVLRELESVEADEDHGERTANVSDVLIQLDAGIKRLPASVNGIDMISVD